MNVAILATALVTRCSSSSLAARRLPGGDAAERGEAPDAGGERRTGGLAGGLASGFLGGADGAEAAPTGRASKHGCCWTHFV